MESQQTPSSTSGSSPPIEEPQFSRASEHSTESPAPQKCAHCKTPAPERDAEDESEQEKGLKPCSKCHTALYCSRDCSKAAWKTHKKTCAADAQKYALSVKEKPAAAPRVPKREGHRGGLQKWQFDT